MAPAVGKPSGAERFDRLDALRGVAIVWMAAFHFCFDLNHYGFIWQDFYTNPLWTVQRSAIVTLFLFCIGLGQAVALDQGQTTRRFWRRWAQIAGCAVLVSFGSALMFPRSYISFGVLHGIAVILLLLRLVAPAGRWLWPLGGAALLMPLLVRHPFFDTRATNWVGLVTHKPITEDYVPVLPWLGVALWGLAAGQWALRHRPVWFSGALPAALGMPARPLALLGRWSLSFYMLHQPVLIGAVMAAAWLLHPQ
ncbi:MAG: heparan-alpha-glucosaminide N-acetyltransferase [Burkholderiales bacterium]